MKKQVEPHGEVARDVKGADDESEPLSPAVPALSEEGWRTTTEGRTSQGIQLASASQNRKVNLDGDEEMANALSVQLTAGFGEGADRRISLQDAHTVENPISAANAGKAEEEEGSAPNKASELDQAQQQALITKKTLPSLLTFATIIVSLVQNTGMVIDVKIPWPAKWIQVKGQGPCPSLSILTDCSVTIADTAAVSGCTESGPEPGCGFGRPLCSVAEHCSSPLPAPHHPWVHVSIGNSYRWSALCQWLCPALM